MARFRIEGRNKLAARRARVLKAQQRAVAEGVKATGEETKKIWRGHVNQAFSGSRMLKRGNRRVANAVRAKVYRDNDGDRVRSLVYSGFVKIRNGRKVDIIAERLLGGLVKARKVGGRLAIPLNPRGVKRNLSYFKGRGIDLAPVPIGGGRILLVEKRKTRSIPHFLLVRQVKFPRLVSPAGLVARPRRVLGPAIQRAWRRQAATLGAAR